MVFHAVVSGAASGIGAECCRDLVSRGWVVHGLDLDEKNLHELKQELGGEGTFHAWPCDISNSKSLESTFAKIRGITNTVNAIVCSAGIFRPGPLLSTSERDFDAMFAVNVKGAWLIVKAALTMLEESARLSAVSRVVFVSSMAALRPKVGGGVYAASKVALGHVTRVLAVELADKGILVNAVAPTTVDTPMTRSLTAQGNGYKLSGTSPLGRVAEAKEIVAVIRFLLSEDSSYVNGAILPVDGGTSAAFRPAI